ncbi:MAG TPA: thioredoxin family protein [Planctomycetota bacterium]|jgi:peroxiredoxin|nr:thioredoxin family protein [Planctomycetota bacterium]
MALTRSTMLPLETPAPDFELPDTVSGKTVALRDLAARKGLLVMFLCTHCPYVRHIREGLARFGRDYAVKDLAMVAISANDPVTHPDDAPQALAKDAKSAGYKFPMLFDESQEVAKAYTAACTPDFFVFDRARKLVYRGQFDDSRPETKIPVTGASLRAAVEALLDDKPIPPEQKASLGCNIKWRAGNEPDYFG